MQKSKKLLVVFLLIFLLVFSFALTSCEEKELKIDKTAETIEVGATVTVKATYGDAAISGDALKFATDKEGIITIAASGDSYVVTGVKKGTVVVTFSVDDKSVTVTITVNDTAGDAAAALAAAKTAKIAELDALLATYAQANYSTANWAILTGYITTAKATVNSATTVTAVNAVSKTTVKASCDTVKTLAQEQAEADAAAAAAALAEAKVAKKAQIEALLANYIQANYSVEGWAQIVGIIDGGKAAVDALTIKADVEAYSTAALTTACGKISTAAQEKALKAAKDLLLDELDDLQDEFNELVEEYSNENWAILQGIVTAAQLQVKAYTNLADLQTYRFAAVRAAVEAVLTIEEKESLEDAREALLEELDALLEEGYDSLDYSAVNWAKIVEIVETAKAATLAAATEAELPEMSDVEDACNIIIDLTGEEELAEAIELAYEEIDDMFKIYKQSDYSAARWADLLDIIAKAKAKIAKLPNAAAVEEYDLTVVESALAEVMKARDEETFEEAKIARIEVVGQLIKAFKKSDYSVAGYAALEKVISDAQVAIAACTTQAALDAITDTSINTKLGKVANKEQEKFINAVNAKLAAIEALKPLFVESAYTPDRWEALTTIISNAITAVKAFTYGVDTLDTVNAYNVKTVENSCKAIQSIAKQLELAKNAKVDAIKALIADTGAYPKANYATAEWAIITDLIAKKTAEINAFTKIALVNNFDVALVSALLEEVDTATEALVKAKAAKTIAINAIKDSYDLDNDYTAAGKSAIEGVIAAALLAVNGDGDTDLGAETIAELNAIKLSDIKAECNAVLTALGEAIKRVTDGLTETFESYTETNYTSNNWKALKKIIDDAKAAVKALTTVEDVEAYEDEDLLEDEDGAIEGTSALELVELAAYNVMSIAKDASRVDISKTGGTIDLLIAAGSDLAEYGVIKANYSQNTTGGKGNNWKRIETIISNAKKYVAAITKTTDLDEFDIQDVVDEILAVLRLEDWTDLGADGEVGGEDANADVDYKGETTLLADKAALTLALTNLRKDYVDANYYADQLKALNKIFTDADAAIKAAFTFEELAKVIPVKVEEAADLILVKTDYDALVAARVDKLAELDELFANYEQADYSAANWTILKGLIDNARLAINKITEIEEVNVYNLGALETLCDGIKDLYDEVNAAQLAKIDDLDVLDALYVRTDYSAVQQSMLNAIYDAAKKAINNLSDVEAIVTYDLDVVAAQFDGVMTIAAIALVDAKAEALATVDAILAHYNEADYSATNWTALVKKINDAKKAINALTTAAAVEAYDFEALIEACEAIRTLED